MTAAQVTFQRDTQIMLTRGVAVHAVKYHALVDSTALWFATTR
jgi:hypothetical protein